MKRVLLSLLLLVTFGFGLVAGPHPCHEAAAEGERPSAPAQPSCHGAAAPAGPSAAQASLSPAGQDCCDVACPHACHMVAVVSAELLLFTAVPLSQRPAEKAVRGVPHVVSGIDHVPIA